MAKGHRPDSKTRVQYVGRMARDNPDYGDPSGDNGLQRGTNSTARLDDESADKRHSSATKTSSEKTFISSLQYILPDSMRVFDEGASNQDDLHTDTPDNVIGATCSELTDRCQYFHPSNSVFEDAGSVEEDINPREIECRSSQKAVCARSKHVIKKELTLNTDGSYPKNDIYGEARQHHLEMIFYNQGPKRDATRKFQVKLAFQDQIKDCVCYDLQDNGYDFPPAFENFREVPDEERLVCLVAFQKDLYDSQLGVYFDVVLLQPFSEDRIKRLNVDVMERYPHAAKPLPFPHGPFKGESGCVPMLCPLVYGASGGIAVTFDESDKLIAYVCTDRVIQNNTSLQLVPRLL